MIEDLYNAGKITMEDVETWNTFEVSEMGRRWFQRMVLATFMEEVPPEFIAGQRIAFVDGRRSLLREIRHTLLTIQQLTKDYQNDHPRAEGKPE